MEYDIEMATWSILDQLQMLVIPTLLDGLQGRVEMSFTRPVHIKTMADLNKIVPPVLEMCGLLKQINTGLLGVHVLKSGTEGDYEISLKTLVEQVKTPPNEK